MSREWSRKSTAEAYRFIEVSLLPIHMLSQSLLYSCSVRFRHLVGNANDTASRTSTRVARLLGLLVSALAEVIGASVDDNGALCKPVSKTMP